jgi:hypothetical protein
VRPELLGRRHGHRQLGSACRQAEQTPEAVCTWLGIYLDAESRQEPLQAGTVALGVVGNTLDGVVHLPRYKRARRLLGLEVLVRVTVVH